jgi:hypothetical protein
VHVLEDDHSSWGETQWIPCGAFLLSKKGAQSLILQRQGLLSSAKGPIKAYEVV